MEGIEKANGHNKEVAADGMAAEIAQLNEEYEGLLGRTWDWRQQASVRIIGDLKAEMDASIARIHDENIPDQEKEELARKAVTIYEAKKNALMEQL